MTTLYLCACSIVAYAGFCRLVRFDLRSRLAARLAFWLLTVSASSGLVAVGFWGYRPEWPAVAMACAMACVQIVASDLWRWGVPPEYIRPSKRNAYRMRRRVGDPWPDSGLPVERRAGGRR